MSDPYLGEIRLFPYPGIVPKGWAVCEGQQLAISQNQALFSLLGTAYGGNGVTTFQLPDLRGRVPIHAGVPYSLGNTGGEAAHTLLSNEIPTHNHLVNASSVAAAVPDVAPTSTWAAPASSVYGQVNSLVAMSPAAIGSAGGSQPHENMQPYLSVAFCIATAGIYPSRN